MAKDTSELGKDALIESIAEYMLLEKSMRVASDQASIEAGHINTVLNYYVNLLRDKLSEAHLDIKVFYQFAEDNPDWIHPEERIMFAIKALLNEQGALHVSEGHDGSHEDSKCGPG